MLRLLANPFWSNPFSAHQLLVLLGEDSISVIQQSRGIQKHTKHLHTKVNTSLDDFKSDKLAWAPALKQLDNMLLSMPLKPNTLLNITLGSEFVRYLSLPPMQIQMNTDEKIRYVNAAYEDIYGDIVENWDIKLNDSPDKQSILAAAIDQQLLVALNQLVTKHQLVINSLQPYLMRAFNALASQITKNTGYLAIVEMQRILLINLQAGKLQKIRIFVMNNHWQSELNHLILRESLLSDNHNNTVLLYAPAHKNLVLKTNDTTQIKRIHVLKKALHATDYALLEVAL